MIFINRRIYASFATPNSFGCYLSMIISFVAAQLFRKRSFKPSKNYLWELVYFAFYLFNVNGIKRGLVCLFGVDFIFEYLDSWFGGVLFNLGDSNGDYSAVLSSFYKGAAG